VPRLSVAAPCFNEAESIAEVVAEWDRVLDSLGFESEISLCNDGSTDASAEILAELQKKYARLRVVSFEKNGGYGRALSAAIRATRGELVVPWTATVSSTSPTCGRCSPSSSSTATTA
jgi:dolichol-phosphate mannosyltransferase